MADRKKSFLLYVDIIGMVNKLPDDKAGLLFKHILSYVNDKNPVSDDILVNVSFEPIKASLKRDLEKYERIRERNAQNGSKGGRPKKEPKKPTGLTGNPKKPQKADSDSVSDSGNESDIKKISLAERFPTATSILRQVHTLFEEKYFNTDAKKEKWLTEVDKLLRIDEYNKDQIIDAIKYGKQDDFWNSKLISLSEIRKRKGGAGSPTKFDNLYNDFKSKVEPGKTKSVKTSDFYKPIGQ